MTIQEKQINEFIVSVFNDVLRLEESSLAKGTFCNLSVNEMHVIEAVYHAQEKETNTMAELAAKLQITASTLTIAVKTLEQKGYLQRTRSDSDKRRVLVTPTASALQALAQHDAFHEQLIKSVSANLNESELAALTLALSTLHRFFKVELQKDL
ncbi:MAG: MarR family transcriptional regulator [Oscillospiraceae bacterium]|nr:MarR family transcriptional regulator [Oscillospiraceae bacterium]